MKVEPTIWGYVVHCVTATERVLPYVRMAATVVGIAIITMAVGIWLVPTAYIGAETPLVKLITSSMGFYGGMMLLQAGQNAHRPEVQLDLQRREVRLVERNRRGASRLISCHAFSSLSDIRIQNGELLAFGRQGEELMRVRINNLEDAAHVERRLRAEVFGAL